jgi:CheY-like chemotaxis protein
MKNNFSILLIDDSYIDRLVTAMLIKNTLGITTVHEAAGGKKALEFLLSPDYDFSQRTVMLLDIKMPEMSGFEFLDEFEKLDDGIKNNIEILMLSSTLDPDDIYQSKTHPRVLQLLGKPLSINELKLVLEQLF